MHRPSACAFRTEKLGSAPVQLLSEISCKTCVLTPYITASLSPQIYEYQAIIPDSWSTWLLAGQRRLLQIGRSVLYLRPPMPKCFMRYAKIFTSGMQDKLSTKFQVTKPMRQLTRSFAFAAWRSVLNRSSVLNGGAKPWLLTPVAKDGIPLNTVLICIFLKTT